MEFQRVLRTDPERAFIVVRNVYSTASLTDGQWAAWDIQTTQDGVAVTRPVLRMRSAIAGVAVETIPNGSYGVLQCWGYKSNARCRGGTGGTAASKVTIGAALKFQTSGFAAQNFAKNSAQLKSYSGKFPCGIVIAPLNTAALVTQFNTSGAYRVLIRCL